MVRGQVAAELDLCLEDGADDVGGGEGVVGLEGEAEGGGGVGDAVVDWGARWIDRGEWVGGWVGWRGRGGALRCC